MVSRRVIGKYEVSLVVIKGICFYKMRVIVLKLGIFLKSLLVRCIF